MGPISQPSKQAVDSDTAIAILIVDANREINDLIRLVLEDTGRYQVLQATSTGQAIEIANQSDLDLVILDLALPDLPGPELVRRLRETRPKMEVMVIPLNEKLKGAKLSRSAAAGSSNKPFYLPELPSIVENALGLGKFAVGAQRSPSKDMLPQTAEGQERAAIPPVEQDIDTFMEPILRPYAGVPQWLEEADEAEFYLSDIILESAAVAALLTRAGRLWASTGGLPKSYAQEITDLVTDDYLGKGTKSALIRYLPCPAAVDDFLLYTTTVMAGMDLTLVFPASIPLGTIRRQASGLAKTLSEVDPLSFEY